MGFLLAVLSFVVAEEVVELEPVLAQADITCDAVTGFGEAKCKAVPGCFWNTTGTPRCSKDDCWSFSASATQAQVPSGAAVATECDCPNTNFSWGHPTNCNSETYDKRDTYCHNKNSVALNRCSYTYLVNQSTPAPFCKLVTALGPDDTVDADANVQKGEPVVGCTPDGNGQLVGGALCSCLGAWDSCNSHPRCYASGQSCLFDDCVDKETCDDGCKAVQVYKPTVNVGTITGTTLENICVKTGSNETPNKCFYLVYLNVTSPSPYCLPGLTPITSQCTAQEGCTLAENDPLYVNYFRTKYFCHDENTLPPGSGYRMLVPSFFVVLAALVFLL